LAAALLGGLLILSGAVHVGTVSAREAPRSAGMPEAPVPGYTPRFVTQTDERPPWDDCLWASGAMLLDKWTSGHAQPDRQRLRRASGDFNGGSTFADFARAVSRIYGWRPHWSPDGGDRLTWNGLLDRLEAGGGAIVAGDYGDLGNPYIRWDRSYAANRSASGHAMYVEHFDRAHDRLWLMDPLGRGGYRGEWVAARRLNAFLWKRNGFVHALATPAPPAHSATGYVAGPIVLDGQAHRAGESVRVTLPFTRQGPWKLPNLVLDAKWEQVASDEAQPTAAVAPAPDDGTEDAPQRATTKAPLFAGTIATADGLPVDVGQSSAPAGVVTASQGVSGLLRLPDEPGLWRLAPEIKRGDGRELPDSWLQPQIEVRVWGDRGAVLEPAVPPAEEALAAAQRISVTVSVEDTGRLAWTNEPAGPDLGEDVPTSATRLEATWVDAQGRESRAMVPLTLTAAPGQQQSITLSFLTPRLPGAYELTFDVRDGSGSLLAPEAAGAGLALVIAPAPVLTAAPIQNQ